MKPILRDDWTDLAKKRPHFYEYRDVIKYYNK